MGFDFAKRRAELQAAMDLNAMQQTKLVQEMHEYMKEFRSLELQEHEARSRFRVPPMRKPTGIMK